MRVLSGPRLARDRHPKLAYPGPETLRQVSKGLVGLVIPELNNPIRQV